MYHQFSYVDSNYCGDNVARSINTYTGSASPSSYYVQEPMQNNIHALNYFSNLQHVDPNSHASATPAICMPMSNMMNSVNQYETPNVENFNSMQSSVSSLYSSANYFQYISSPSNMPIGREIGHATSSYLANYPQPSYAAPYATNFSVPYATPDIYNSVPHIDNGYSRMNGYSVGANEPSSSVAAYDTSPVQVQNFGNTTLLKESESIGGKSYAGTIVWDGAELTKFSSFVQGLGEKARDFSSLVQIHEAYKKLQKEEALRNNSSSMSNSVMEKAEYKNTLDESVEPKEASFNDQERDEHGETAVCDFSGCEGVFVLPNEFRAKEIENIAEPSSVDKEHRNEEAHDRKNKDNKMSKNQQEAEQEISMKKLDISPFPIKAIDFENKKVLIRSDQAESTKGKNVLIDNNAAPRMIKPKTPEVGVQKVYEIKRKSAPRPKPTIKQLLNKYTSSKGNNRFNRLGGTKCPRFPSGREAQERWRGQASYFHQKYIPQRPMLRSRLQQRRSGFNQEVGSHDAFIIRGSQSQVQSANGQNNKGGRNLVWMPVKRVKGSDGPDVAHDLELGEYQPAEVVHNQKTSNTVGLHSVPKEAVNGEKHDKLQRIGSDIFVKDQFSLEDHMQNGKRKARIVSTSTSQKLHSVGARTNSVTRSRSPGTSTSLSPLGNKSSIDTSMQCMNSISGGSRKIEADGVSGKRRLFSAMDSVLAPRIAVRQYRPRNSGGNRIISVAPGTKPEPQWCPSGLTRTQKRRVQRLRASEIREKIAKKKSEESCRDKPMVPTNIWKVKRIASQENENADDTVAAENSENKTDAPNYTDVNTAFALPTEFRAPEAEVAELTLGPKYATFEKAKKHGQHLNPLFISGHIDGNPIWVACLLTVALMVIFCPFRYFLK